jgi:hypothetical protein
MKPALRVTETLAPLSSGKLPQEVIVLDPDSVGIVVEVDGVDYILTMSKIPVQRAKPRSQ